VQGRAYIANTPPEETSQLSGRVTFDVPAGRSARRPWWPYAVAAALVLAVLCVAGWFVLRPDPPGPPGGAESPAPGRSSGPILHVNSVTIVPFGFLDLDNGSATDTAATGQDLYFDGTDVVARTDRTGGKLQAISGAMLGRLPAGAHADLEGCARASLSRDPLPAGDHDLPPGSVLCVRTYEGRTAVITVDATFIEIKLRYDLFAATP
jgi:hypothetical protein